MHPRIVTARVKERRMGGCRFNSISREIKQPAADVAERKKGMRPAMELDLMLCVRFGDCKERAVPYRIPVA